MPDDLPPTDNIAIVRLLGPDDVQGFVDLLIGEGETLGGSPASSVIRAVGKDAASNRGSLITVADLEGRIVGAMVTLVGGAPTYWRRFVLRHPGAGSDLLTRRIRKRIRSTLRQRTHPDPGAAPSTKALPADLRSDPRLHIAPPEGFTVRSTYRAVGPHLAYGPLVVVSADQRGRRIAQRLHATAFDELRRRGITTYTNSFLLDYEPSIRLYLRMGFTIYRFPFGFYGMFDIRRDRSGADHGGEPR